MRTGRSFWLWFGLVAASAHAREVQLQWSAIDGATAYEFEIRRNTQAVVNRRVDAQKTEWAVRLPPGVYVFRLRAIDWSGQPGEWSDPAPLFSEPLPPVWEAPAPKAVVGTEDAKVGVELRWKSSAGAQKYVLEWRKGSASPASQVLTTTSWRTPALEPGEYSARITPRVELEGALPAGIDKRAWDSEAGAWQEFHVGEAPEAESEEQTVVSKKSTSTPPATWDVYLGANFAFFKLDLVDQATAGQAILISQLVTGAEAAIARHGQRWSQFFRAQFANASLFSIGSRNISTDPRTIGDLELGTAWRVFSRRNVRLRFFGGGGHVPAIRTNSNGDIAFEPALLWKFGLGLDLPLSRDKGHEVRLEARGTGILSRTLETGEFVRHGVGYSFAVAAEGDLVAGFSSRAQFGYRGLWLNTSNVMSTRSELFAGFGFALRW